MKPILYALAGGTILVYFSELVFYGEISLAGANVFAQALDFGLMLGLYTLLGSLSLAIVHWARAKSLWALFLAGAVYGWLLEGVAVTTMYEEFPFQVHFTGLAWHAPLDFLTGWYLLPASLREKSPLKTCLMAGGLGLFWGTWMVGRWWDAGTPLAWQDFTRFALWTTALLLPAIWLAGKGQEQGLHPPRWFGIAAAAFLAAWFGLGVVPKYPFALAVLPPLLGASFLGLYRNRKNEAGSEPTRAPAPLRWQNLPGLLLMPVLASATYAIFLEAGARLPLNLVYYVLSSILGTGLFCLSLFKILKARRQGNETPASP